MVLAAQLYYAVLMCLLNSKTQLPSPALCIGQSKAPVVSLGAYLSKVGASSKYGAIQTDNPHSFKGTLHLGFKQEGLLRRHTLDPTSQTHMDVIQTSLLVQHPADKKVA